MEKVSQQRGGQVVEGNLNSNEPCHVMTRDDKLDLLYCLGKKSLGRIPEAECMELPHLALPQKTGSKRNVKPCSEALRSYSNSPKCWVEKGVVGLGLIFLDLQGQRGCR